MNGSSTMTDQADHLVQFSNVLATRVAAMKHAIVAIRLAHERHVTGTVWQSDVIVASEQSLPRRDEFEIVAAGGSVLTAKTAGRDPGTNIAILRLTNRSRRHPLSRARRMPARLPSRSELTDRVAQVRDWGSSISPAPNGIAAAAASLIGALCSIFALPVARRADPSLTPLAAVSGCRLSGRAGKFSPFLPQPSIASYRCCSRKAASLVDGLVSRCKPSPCPMRYARPLTSQAA